MKTFKDLQFEPHPTAIALIRTFPSEKGNSPYMQELCNATWAVMDFPNGYSISVVCGIQFYSNGRDTYEVAVLYEGILLRYFPVEGSVRGWQTKEQVSQLMIELQKKEE